MAVKGTPFTPSSTGNTSITAATTSVRADLPSPRGGYQVRIASLSSGNVGYMAIGSSTVLATTDGTAILPGSVELFTTPVNAIAIAFVTTGSNTFYIGCGEGI